MQIQIQSKYKYNPNTSTMQIQTPMQGVPTADLREPGGAWEDEDTTPPGRQRGLSQHVDGCCWEFY